MDAVGVIGREAELLALEAAVDRALQGASATMLLVGEAGIGKTRLLEAVASRAANLGTAVLVGTVRSASSGPFDVIGDALRSWLRGREPSGSMGAFDRGLMLVLPEWPATTNAAELDAAQRRLLAFEGVVHLLRRIVDDAGAVVLIADDLHAADAESVAAFRYIATAAIAGVAVIGAMRRHESSDADEVAASLRTGRGVDVVEVSPLGERAVGALVAALIDAIPPSPLVADILARTDGVPLLVEEVVRGHLDAGSIGFDAVSGVTWRGGAAKVPATVQDLVAARLARLADRQRDVIVAGAVIGDFLPSAMRVVTGVSDDLIADTLAAGVRVGLLETRSGGLGFRHAIIQEAVLDAAVPHLVDTLHHRAAEAFANDAGLGAEGQQRRARHLAAIGADDEAAAALAKASDAWLGAYALLAAERAARQACDLARTPGTRETASDALARALAAQGRWSEALELDEAAAAEHGDPVDRQVRRAMCAIEAGQPERAELVLGDAPGAGDAVPALMLASGRVAIMRGEARQALVCSRHAKASLEVSVEERLAALELEGRAHGFLGDRTAASEAWTRQASEAAAAGRTQAELRAVVHLARIELLTGQPPERLREAVILAEAAGSLIELVLAEENLAAALALRGHLGAAAVTIDRVIERCRDLRLDRLAYLVAERAIIRSYFVASAEEELAEAEAMTTAADLHLLTAALRADIALRACRWEESIEWLERASLLAVAIPGVVPMNAPAWLPWAYAAGGNRRRRGRRPGAGAGPARPRLVPIQGRTRRSRRRCPRRGRRRYRRRHRAGVGPLADRHRRDPRAECVHPRRHQPAPVAPRGTRCI